jgi:hypothetical protein
VIALLRMNYERARTRDERRTVRQDDASTGRRLEAIDNAGDRVMAPGKDFS